ncbi:hypothetical protein LTR47_007802 [Exophiala xenobiotica]|nr:hypothetical protein LTR47_007802 [Exophiala xenobiotica]KAK5243655.1 hypothetical protein LTS06_010628 [Exophiala xenobiotica]KAK5282289.1 hypothetical protein LTR40_003532 [Exophiala xenobiotica]KAK5348336.1 hypothetical protein LTR61_007795 [Exophiala xenobiotica]KAK5366333.1 hypothetical protein LTR11_008376 [Exophiala xenobiotica]
MTYSIDEISDRLEILDKFARYVHAVDDHCIEFLDEIFLPETVFDWSTSGGIRTTWAEAKKGDFITGKLFPYAFHVCTNIVIDFDEGHQSATARSKTIHPTGLKGSDEKDMMFQVQGVYVDKLVIVVGAGPAGLLLSLLLARAGINVLVLEAAKWLDSQPRATHYAPPAVRELRRAGVLDEVRARGFITDVICWRKIDGSYLVGLDNRVMKGQPGDDNRVTCLPLDQLGQILYKHLQKHPQAEVRWSHTVTAVAQDEQEAWVNITTPTGTERASADYVVGCDGANSQVRKCLFGDGEFPGKTWEEQIVATNTYYPFEKYDYEHANFIIHPEHWYMASKITTDGCWRVTYGEKLGFTREELLARQPWKFETMLPGHPTPDQYRITNFSPYKVHQRLAKSMRVGRCLLAADAAHLCNPFGGLGLTGGIVDVGGLADCLIGIHRGVADSSILDIYDSVRREKYTDIINPISSANLVRLHSTDPETVINTDPFFRMAKKAETDVQYARQLADGINTICYDFTQHYYRNAQTTSSMAPE